MPDARLNYTVLDMFSDRAFGGSPLGVITEAGALDQEQMQLIASEIATPRTAFVTGGAADLFKVMFFTPSHRLPYSALAAMGAAVQIVRQDQSSFDSEARAITISTSTVDIKAKISPGPKDSAFSIGAFLPRPSFASFGYNLALLAGVLGTDQEDIPPAWPLGLAFAGTWNLVVPMLTEHAVQEVRPDMEALSDLTKKLQCQSVILYSHCGPNEIHCRTLSPGIGLSHQPMSATALGSVCSLLVKESAVSIGEPSTVITAKEQMEYRQPKAKIEIYGMGEKINAIQITGTCIEVLNGKVPIPAGSDHH